MNVTLTRVNSSFYEINDGAFVANHISGGWVIVERNQGSAFGNFVASGASLDAVIENWLYPAAKGVWTECECGYAFTRTDGDIVCPSCRNDLANTVA